MNFEQIFSKWNRSEMYIETFEKHQSNVSPVLRTRLVFSQGSSPASRAPASKGGGSMNTREGSPRVESAGEARTLLPSSSVLRPWAYLTKIWQSNKKNKIQGFIVNSVKGGYSVALAGFIAFLPRRLRRRQNIFPGQLRLFSILNMNVNRNNIVVKELRKYRSKGQTR
uniref:Ribosomal protein S1 n=1 Tax=Chaetosphaeridium globosum TaxID=96477 RepID=Q8M1D8_CHAGL|nr:ribosomal protein S1 [Chaetosphaeridium globosum]AAM96617.1 ribosomal protein S1 [Chaetosphaeridium globosum]